jgi:hypothetical protein
MGHEPHSDREWMDLISIRSIGLARGIAGGQNPSWVREEVIRGERLTARIALLSDYERNDGTLCIRIFVNPIGTSGDGERAIYIRWDGAARKLHDPKVWRKLGRLQKTNGSKNMVQNSRDIYWRDAVPAADLKAQIVIALIQMRLLSENSALHFWLPEYIRDNYRIRFSTQGSRRDDRQTRDEVALRVADKLKRQWSFPEDFRAFRFYVSKLVRVALSETLGSAKREISATAQKSEPYFLPKESEDTNAHRMFKRSVHDPPYVPGNRSGLNVEEIADRLRVSKRYIYKLLERGIVQGAGNPICIPNSEIIRIETILEERRQRSDEKRELQRLGVAREAARKKIYRRFGPLPHI